MKPLVIYHADCCDGFGAAFAAWLTLGDDAEYVPMHHLKSGAGVADFLERVPLDCSVGERDVYILDFSLPKVVMDWLFGHASRVVWLDHHKTAFEMWCGGLDSVLVKDGKFEEREAVPDEDANHIILDNNRSGAYLAWDYFRRTEVPLLFLHIDDYDRWQFKIEGTKAFHAALRSYQPWSFWQWKAEFHSASPYGTMQEMDNYFHLITAGEAILRAQEQHVQSVLRNATRKCRILRTEPKAGGEHWEASILIDATGLAANAPAHLSSELGHQLANQSGTFGLVWFQDVSGKIRCSLRSNGDYDVSAIAKAFGGGGHRNAAGFSTDMATLQGWLK